MKKQKFFIATLTTLGLLLSTGGTVLATPGQNGDLPPADSEFWSVISNLKRPDSADCVSVVDAEMESKGYPLDQVPVNQICTSLATMPNSIQAGMTQGGTTTNLFDAPDWHSVQNLYFEHSTNGVKDGRISFTKPIDFMSYNFMSFFMNFGTEMDMGQGILGLDATVVGGMQGYGAVLTMYNLPDYSNPEILVDGKEDTNNVVSNLIYDRTNHTLTFDAAHFTTFKVVEGSTNTGNAPKVRKITSSYVKADGQTEIKMVISGDHFTRNTKVKLDGKKSIHQVMTNNLITTYFKLPTNLVKVMVYLRLSNPNDQAKREKINLTRIPYSHLY